MLDVDHFKNINDTYGHSIGDKCLKAIAQTLQKNVRKDNDRVGRYGGEEFLILLPQTDPEAAALIAEHLRQEVKKISFTELGDTGLHLSVTIGLASLQLSQHKDAETLISEADQALYKGKQSGRDQVVAATV